MKLPRWLMFGLWTSIVLAVLTAAGWWWVTWPERTMREFTELMLAGKLDDAKLMMRREQTTDRSIVWGISCDDPNDWIPDRLAPEPRTIIDLMDCRQRFRFNWDIVLHSERGMVRGIVGHGNSYCGVIWDPQDQPGVPVTLDPTVSMHKTWKRWEKP